jgi:hypothetical protein
MRPTRGIRDRAGTRLAAVAVGVAIALPLLPATTAASGLFAPYQAYPVGSSPEAVAIGDVTGDGRADVVMTTSYDFDPANDFRLWVFTQASDGTLSAPVSYPTAASYTLRAESVSIGDITGDGRADVVLGVAGLGVQVFPQDASGALGSPTLTETTDSLRVRLGHLDAGGSLDVAGIGWGADTVTVLLNDGHGGLASGTTYPAQHGGYDDLEVADVTDDGQDDIVVMSGQTYAIPNITVLAQLAEGGFGFSGEYRVGTNVNTHGIGVGDVSGDGRNDVVASYGGNSPSSFIGVFQQNESGTLDGPMSYTSYDIPEPVDVADVDLDGRADVVTLHGGWNQAGVYRQGPSGSLGSEELYPIPYAGYNPHGLAVGDVSGDGLPDIVLADPNHGLVVLRHNPQPQPPTAPGAPTLVSATAGDASVSLAWTAPASDGGAPISGYVATASPGGATCSAAGLGCTIGGLTNGTAYSLTVRASNVAGIGPPSNALSATPKAPGQPPSAPGNLATSSNLPEGIGLTWSAPSSAGTAPIGAYRIYRGGSSGGETYLATVGNVLSFTDGTASNGGLYFYQVAAVNAVGEGPRSAERSAQRGTAPSAPRTLTASSNGPGGVSLKWTAPLTNGGSAVTGYRIYRGTAAGGEVSLISVNASATSFADKGATKGVRYYYFVTATNVLGVGPASNEASAVAK